MAELYSANRIKNPSAETGDTSEWNVSNVTVADGGTSGTKTFKLTNNAKMEQTFNSSVLPTRLLVSADFLPETLRQKDTPVTRELQVLLEYGDGTFTKITIPLTGREGDY